MVTEETVFNVLHLLRTNPDIKLSNISMDRQDFFDALEIIDDSGYAKNIHFTRGKGNAIVIAFYENAKITMKGIHFLEGYKQPSPVAEEDKSVCVFLSYSWANDDIAQSIDTYLQSNGYNVIRDVREISHWHSIREFMNTIRRQEYAILIISDEYLHSPNCMYEVGEILKEEDYKNRIIPVVTEPSIYDPVKRLDYIKYWESESQKLKMAMEEVSMTNRGEATAMLKRYMSISMNMEEFLQIVSDMNNPAIKDVKEAILTKLQHRV